VTVRELGSEEEDDEEYEEYEEVEPVFDGVERRDDEDETERDL